MTPNLFARVREFIFPSSPRLKANFPCHLGVPAAAGVILLALLFNVVATIASFFWFTLAAGVLAALSPALAAAMEARQDVLTMSLMALSWVAAFSATLLLVRRLAVRGSFAWRSDMRINLDSLSGSLLRAIGVALLGMLAVRIGQVLVSPLIPEVHDPAGELGMRLAGGAFVIFAAQVIILAPLFEEILFRGFFFNMLRSSLRRCALLGFAGGATLADFLAVAVSGAVFAAVHGSLTAFPFLFVIGVVLAEVYRRSGSLWPAIILHAINNSLATLVLWLGLGS